MSCTFRCLLVPESELPPKGVVRGCLSFSSLRCNCGGSPMLPRMSLWGEAPGSHNGHGMDTHTGKPSHSCLTSQQLIFQNFYTTVSFWETQTVTMIFSDFMLDVLVTHCGAPSAVQASMKICICPSFGVSALLRTLSTVGRRGC